ncbi:hypothetical protein RRG08_012778 [Elysia crispata]|uniref:Uncharacterized protein n=1 Tax=Elysia crispata TaxID=231223 RepID=A0AAE0YRR4_9GAST|nr:hypothetical protein RRG08_012778 [Elysia crispata]
MYKLILVANMSSTMKQGGIVCYVGYYDGLDQDVGFAVQVLNRYQTEYFARAVNLASSLIEKGYVERYVYTTHPWLVSLYLDCPDITLLKTPLKEWLGYFEILRAEFPGAELVASTFDNFVAALEKVKASLPVRSFEIGDTWIQGVTSDPKKSAMYRAFVRAWENCSLIGVDTGVSLRSPSGKGLQLLSLDVPIVFIGTDDHVDNPFPVPLQPLKCASVKIRTMSYNVYNNIWNTNFIYWYPYEKQDADFKARFEIKFLH